MMKFCVFFLLTTSVAFNLTAQNEAEVIKFDRLDKIIKSKGDDVKVINFWATWCAPCIKELPYFEALPKQMNGREISVTLINIDFVEKLDKVNSFMERKEIKSEVLLLDEMDYNSWIDRVDPSWSGAIPATLIIDRKTGTRKFIEGELTKEELNKHLEKLIEP